MAHTGCAKSDTILVFKFLLLLDALYLQFLFTHVSFLADSTMCPSVDMSVCNVRIVTKRYVLPRNCLKKQLGLLDPRGTILDPLRLPFPQTGVLITDCTSNICIANCGKTLQIATRLLLTAYRNLLTLYPTVQSPTPTNTCSP